MVLHGIAYSLSRSSQSSLVLGRGIGQCPFSSSTCTQTHLQTCIRTYLEPNWRSTLLVVRKPRQDTTCPKARTDLANRHAPVHRISPAPAPAFDEVIEFVGCPACNVVSCRVVEFRSRLNRQKRKQNSSSRRGESRVGKMPATLG
jgi:hypothetical protein